MVEGYGTGFVVKPKGIIITNQHVVANADRVVVTLPDGTDLPAKVLGEDPLTDIAVLKVDRQGLPTVSTGRSTDLMIGEWVVALGNPYAYLLGNAEPTVTVGVVSATNRNILPSGDQTGLYFDMIQTDAAINPGNSGGPLTNALGEVVGVNSSIFSNSGGSVGPRLRDPDRARAAGDGRDHQAAASVRRAWVGLEVEGASAMRDWKTAGGVTVTSVAPDGPAAKAGLRQGRRPHRGERPPAPQLSRLGGREARPPRGRRRGSLGAERPSRGAAARGDRRPADGHRGEVHRAGGPRAHHVTPAIRAERGLRSEEGVLIFRISPPVSEATGLREGDVILAINRTAVRGASQVGDLLNVRPGEIVRVYLEREGQITFTDLVFR